MRPERWKQVEAVFEQALALPVSERPAFFAKSCGGDDELRREVELLLDSQGRSGNFLDRPSLFFTAGAAGEEGALLTPGQRIGRYRVVREIGRGGMGAVYLGDRADEQYEKRVAIKLIKRGMDTDSVLRQFRNERQILASFDHPNIARLFDADSTESGLPFFVMEYIEGLPIDEYCETHALGITERLKLFREVCAAVSYAHRHLVVHRDLKRSNILVDGDGVPKLLDFGIAKILQQGDDGAQLPATMTGLRLMTPQYASPEQVRGEPVTTASDVYSLGVVLYELLTGQLPHQFATATPSDIGRAIDETQPEKPSTTVAGANDSKFAIRNPKSLKGDLDNIVLMALRKEPARRYSSVDQFSEDIRRHLEALPVRARKDTVGYRGAKFARRNKGSLAAAALVLLILVGGIIATSWQAHIAMRERARSEQRFADVRQLAHSMLFDYHDAIKDLPGSTPVRAQLVRDALKYLDRLSTEAHGDASLQGELAAAYERVGDVQGGTMFANLGDTAGATESYRKSLALREALLRSAPADFAAKRDAGLSYRKLGLLVWEAGDISGGLENVGKALEILASLAVAHAADLDLRYEVHRSHDYLGMILQEHGEVTDALAHYRAAREILDSFPPEQRNSERVRRSDSVSLEHIGTALLAKGDLDNALEQNQKALQVRASLSADFPLNADYRRSFAVSYYNAGEILGKLSRDRDALESYGQNLAIAEELCAADPQNDQYRDDRAYALIRVGDMLAKLGDFAPALARYQQSLGLRAGDIKSDPSNLWKRASLIEVQAKTAKTLAKVADRGAALALCHETLALMEDTAVQPTNAQIRSFFADTYVDMAEAYLILASTDAPPANERNELQKKACDRYRRSLDIWNDIRTRGMLSPADAAKPDAVAQALSNCEAP